MRIKERRGPDDCTDFSSTRALFHHHICQYSYSNPVWHKRRNESCYFLLETFKFKCTPFTVLKKEKTLHLSFTAKWVLILEA